MTFTTEDHYFAKILGIVEKVKYETYLNENNEYILEFPH